MASVHTVSSGTFRADACRATGRHAHDQPLVSNPSVTRRGTGWALHRGDCADPHPGDTSAVHHEIVCKCK
jgi:hypothetical protein